MSVFPAFAEPTVSATEEIGSAWRRYPVGAVRVHTGYPDTLGASTSFFWPRPLTVEGGISLTTFDTATAYGRAGVAIPLRERHRLSDRANRFPAFDLMLSPMAGFRWVDRRGDHADSRGGITFTQSAELMIWTNSRAAIDLQATVGGTYWIYREDAETVQMSPEVGFAAGLAF